MRIDWDALSALPVLDVAAKLGLQVPSGRKIKCFLHEDSRPSLSFQPERNFWYCFGCGVGGGSVQLVMHYLRIGKYDAARWLTESFVLRHRVSTPQTAAHRRPAGAGRKGEDKAARAPAPDPDVYEWLLSRASLQEAGRDHLLRRGFAPETLTRFRFGEVWDPASLLRCAAQTWTVERLISCGLVGPAPRHRPVWWDHVLLVPFLVGGRVVFLQGRRFSPEGPKYLNPFGVAKPLFNVDALESSAPGSRVLICEGAMDAIAATQFGHPAVGVLGAHSFRSEWTELFAHVRVAVVPDNDSAGRLFADKVVKAFHQLGRGPEVLNIPEGKDIADYLARRTGRA